MWLICSPLRPFLEMIIICCCCVHCSEMFSETDFICFLHQTVLSNACQSFQNKAARKQG